MEAVVITSQSDEKSSTQASAYKPFPIVGIGVSAGGLKASENFFKNMPPNSGMAFVLVQHLDPNHQSVLSELLQNHTRMPVRQVENNTKVAPNHVYVIPPNKRLSIRKGILQLSERGERRGSHAVIDLFFRALAADLGEHSVAVVLSGTGTDGTQGLTALKEAGGITFAQSEDDAEYEGMPRSAAVTGLVDFVLNASDMPKKLIEVKDHAAKLKLPNSSERLPEDDNEVLQRIFTQLQTRTGHDFSNYKRNMVLRRIGRRLQVHSLNTLSDYLGYFRNHEDEADALVNELLISVTDFFRDADAFKVLENDIIPQLFTGDEVRVWVTGCATGEEAYSVAMLLAEHNALRDNPLPLQIFASDISERALNFARRGVYPEGITADVSPDRLERFFELEGSSFRVKERLREMVLFTTHNLIKDPPFSRLNLITCRNLLIYLNTDVQERVYRIFNYALKPNGFLFLGASESLRKSSNLFAEVNRSAKLYSYSEVTDKNNLPLLAFIQKVHSRDPQALSEGADVSLATLAQQAVLAHHAPAFAVVNAQYDIVYVSGRTGKYLEHPEGNVTINIVEQAREGLAMELRAALYRCFKQDKLTLAKLVSVRVNGDTLPVSLSVRQLESAPGHVLVLLQEGSQAVLPAVTSSEEQSLAVQLESELISTRESLQTTIEELETSNEELLASNEELQSMNEEIQSTSEELETSREELQFTNEELITVNEELRSKIDEIARVNSDLENLISSTEVGTLFLDQELRLKRFTPAASHIFNLIPADLGRPFEHLSHQLDLSTLGAHAKHVLETLQAVELEAKTDSRRYVVRLLPYRTLDKRIDGVVVNLVDISDLKAAEAALAQRARQQAAVAELGQYALSEARLESLIEQAVTCVHEVLELDLVNVLEKLPDEDALLLTAGVGWDPGLVGSAKVTTNLRSQAGFTLRTTDVVVTENLAEDRRFSGSALLTDHGVTSGLSIIIQGGLVQGVVKPWGIFGAHSRSPRNFSDNDIKFVQSVANVLAEAVRRSKAEQDLQTLNSTLEDRVRTRTQDLRLANAQLREQETFLRSIYNDVSLAVYVIDVEADGFRHIDINPTFVRMTGLERKQVVGKRTDELSHLPQTDQDAMTAQYAQVVSSGESLEYEVMAPLEEGDTWWLVNLTPVSDDQGNIYRIIGTGQPITKRKEAEDALTASEARFRILFEQGPSATCLLILDNWTIVDVNEKCEDVLGYKRGDLQDKSLLNLDIWRNPSELHSLETMIYTENDKREVELQVNQSEGKTGVLCASLELITFADKEHVLLVFEDISEQKRNEAALRDARAKLAEIRTQERLTLARELHDGVLQQLLSLNISMANAQNDLTSGTPTSVASFDSYRQEVLAMAETLRGVVSGMRPMGLEEFGLKQALENLTKDLLGIYKDPPKVSYNLANTDVLSPQLSYTLFRVAQETLHNAFQHAEADNVSLELQLEDSEAYLKITDDGTGFDVPRYLSSLARNYHFGLIGIDERLSLLGGKLQLESSEQGTTLIATVPLT